MLKTEDISHITARGSHPDTVRKQLENFAKGFPFLKINEAASIHKGIIKLDDSELTKYISVFENKISEGLSPLKFVPASGAASRMFQSLFSALDELKRGTDPSTITNNGEVSIFLQQISQFAFFDDLKQIVSAQNQDLQEISAQDLLEWVLWPKGLNYGYLPKGLLKFHRYSGECRTSMEEHFVEGAFYSKNKQGIVKLHFAVSPEHQPAFEKHVAEIKPKYEKLFGVSYRVHFSQQKPGTDTIAVTQENLPFRNDDGSLLFRPAGHGALLENLNELDADLIFIKNIDNVVPDVLKKTTIDYKKALAGVLLEIQEQLFYYQKMLKTHHYNTLDSAFYAEAADYLENILNVIPPQKSFFSEKEEMHRYLCKKFDRPLRVCGMVKNQGEPGGGPFFAQNSDGSVSLQIAESLQIDFNDTEQTAIARNASYFNPVDLVCAVHDYAGVKYDLSDFTDPETGFISTKSKDGKKLRAQELPGLWNGSMSDWNTLFVEVPIETFNPVKTINDLLRKEHQAN